MYSPWGQIDYVDQIEPGLSWVSTPSHGGLRVSKAYAQKNLSIPARDAGIDYAGYLWYEEDCDWAIVALERPRLWGYFFKYSKYANQPDVWYDEILATVKFWCVKYARLKGLYKPGDKFNCYHPPYHQGIVAENDGLVCGVCWERLP